MFLKVALAASMILSSAVYAQDFRVQPVMQQPTLTVKGQYLSVGAPGYQAIRVQNGEVFNISWDYGFQALCTLYAQYPGAPSAARLAVGFKGNVNQTAIVSPTAGTGYSLVCLNRGGQTVTSFFLTPNP